MLLLGQDIREWYFHNCIQSHWWWSLRQKSSCCHQLLSSVDSITKQCSLLILVDWDPKRCSEALPHQEYYHNSHDSGSDGHFATFQGRISLLNHSDTLWQDPLPFCQLFLFPSLEWRVRGMETLGSPPCCTQLKFSLLLPNKTALENFLDGTIAAWS